MKQGIFQELLKICNVYNKMLFETNLLTILGLLSTTFCQIILSLALMTQS